MSLISFETAWFANADSELRQNIIALSGTAGGVIIFCVAFRMLLRAHSILSLNILPGGRKKIRFWDAIQQKKADYRQEKQKYEEYIEKHWNTEHVDDYRWFKKEENKE